jgi:excisionase family DNA binding protein
MSTNVQTVKHLTADDLAARLGITRHAVYRLVKVGRLPVLRIGKRAMRFRLADVEWWESCMWRGPKPKTKRRAAR